MTSIIEKKICLSRCRHVAVKKIAKKAGFKRVPERCTWNVIWSDAPLSIEKMSDMRRYQDSHSIFLSTHPALQRANHFPGMNGICRKDRLALSLNRMKESFPRDYNFFPKTWSLPSGFARLNNYRILHPDATFICKPGVGSQGHGIFLLQDMNVLNPSAQSICQVYIPRPFLIDGFKFDFRIYVLITSCDPLRIYIYDEGIARLATVRYEPPSKDNFETTYMHLTNYSLNKRSKSYSPEQNGSKRTMSSVLNMMKNEGLNTEKLTAKIDDLIVKTLVAVQPTMRQYYRTSFPKLHRACSCFELLGFDILVDEKLKPYLLEVNHSPSLNMDLPVDVEVKKALLKDTFKKLYLGWSGSEVEEPENPYEPLTLTDSAGNAISKALNAQFVFESQQQGNYRLIYPAKNATKYAVFFKHTPDPTYMAATRIVFRNLDKKNNEMQPQADAKKLVTTFKKDKAKPCDAVANVSEDDLDLCYDQSACTDNCKSVSGKLSKRTKISKNSCKRNPTAYDYMNNKEETQKYLAKLPWKTAAETQILEQNESKKAGVENPTKALKPIKSGEFLTYEDLQKSGRIYEIYVYNDGSRYKKERKLITEAMLKETLERMRISELSQEQKKERLY